MCITNNYDYVFDDTPTTAYNTSLFELVATGIVSNNGVLYCQVHILFNA